MEQPVLQRYALSPGVFCDRLAPVLVAAADGDAQAAAAARDVLRLFANPEYVMYNPAELLHKHEKRLRAQRCEVFVEDVGDCAGAPDQLLSLLDALVSSTRLEDDAALAVEVFEEKERGVAVPRISLGLDGPGRIPKEVSLGDYFYLDREVAGDCWTRATRGGRIDDAPNGAALRLSGQRQALEPLPVAKELLQALGEEPTPESAAQALAQLESDGKREAADIESIFRETFASQEQDLQQHAVAIDCLFEALPPIVLHRTQLRRLFLDLFAWARRSTKPHAELDLLAEYDTSARGVTLTCACKTEDAEPCDTFHFAALRRTAAEHDGTFEADCSGKTATLAITICDPVGRTLDTWLPDWEALGEESRRVLRLLKSGGPIPPEDFLLEGILHAELDALLAKRLSSPVVGNIASELSKSPPQALGDSPERLKKALGQLARGKPKKALCEPAYAAEILWVFRSGERKRRALGIEHFSPDDIVALCDALAAPPKLLPALRLLAKYALLRR